MDLSVSPDLDARICYLVVFLCAIFFARLQIYNRLSQSRITGIWLVPSTWVIFAIYLGLPLVLFWLLDRFGAINDTSLFAAFLVGFGYPAILAGGVGGVTPPEGLAGILRPIEAFTDAVATKVAVRSERIDKDFEDYIVSRMIASPECYERLVGLALSRIPDASSLESEIQSIDQRVIAAEARKRGADLDFNSPEARSVIGSQIAVEQKSRAIYLYLSSVPEFLKLLSREKLLMSGWDRLWKSPLSRTRIIVGFAAVSAFFLLFGAFQLAAHPSAQLSYHIWRIGKANNTEQDRFRAREQLSAFLRDERFARDAANRLARQLRAPGLPIERVDSVVQLLLQSRHSFEPLGANLGDLLIAALRVDNVDTRCRVHHALVLLASETDRSFVNAEPELAGWNPNQGDSVVNLESRIALWRWYWRTNGQIAP